jgi:membrane-associated protein
MFNTIKEFILTHEALAPWVIFFSIVLAGLNIPISIDLMIILVAVLAATHLAHIKIILFISFLAGCLLSAWVSYGLGRIVGHRLLSRFFSEQKRDKIAHFLQRYGTISFIVGRFIPFGFRNCLFMTAGFTRYKFFKFALLDGVACTLWSLIFFSLFYHLGQSFEAMSSHLRTINIAIASALGVTVISLICYKYRNRLIPKKSNHE